MFVVELPALGRGGVAQLKPERGVADRAGHHHRVAGLRAAAADHRALRHRSERRDRDRDRPRRPHGIAAEQRASIELGIGPKSARKQLDPGFRRDFGSASVTQEAERLCALGREVGQIHPQRLLRDHVGGIVGKEMHATDDRVGGQHEVVARRRRDHRRVVGQAKRARMGGERTEIGRDQTIFGRFRFAGHRPTLPARIRRRAACARSGRAPH